MHIVFVLASLICLRSSCGYHFSAAISSSNPWRQRFVTALSQSVRSSGYIPPELDPEYRKVPIDRLAAKAPDATGNYTESELSALPLPKEGDIVSFKGRFGDDQIGRLRFVQYVPEYETFFADIVPLKEGKSENVFILDRKSSAEYVRIEDIKPVRFYYVRSENGYKIYKDKTDPQKVVLKAPRYGNISVDYTPRKVFNHHSLYFNGV